MGGGRTRTGIAITEGCCTQTLYTFLYFPLHNHLSSCKFATLVLCRNPSHCDKSRVSAHNSTTTAQVMWFNPMLKKIPAGQNYINANSRTKERKKHQYHASFLMLWLFLFSATPADGAPGTSVLQDRIVGVLQNWICCSSSLSSC